MPNLTKNGELLYQDTKDFPAIIFITCMLSVFSVVGTTGNAFVLYVFSNKKDKNTSTVFILALASIDFVTCLCLIPFTIIVEFQYKKIDNDIMCKIYQFFITSNVPFSAFIMVAIAFDRYFCICRPWMKILDIKSAKKIIASLLIFALILGLITSLAYGVYHRKANKMLTVGRTVSNNISLYSEADTEGAPNGQGIQEVMKHNDWLLDNCSISWKTENNFSRYNTCRLVNSDDVLSKINESTRVGDFVFTGYCYPTEILISKQFRKVYQTFYASLFLIMFLLVFVLYALILRSILNRRSKRLKSSYNWKFNSERKTRVSFMSLLFSKRKSNPETLNMLPCSSDLNNKRPLERKMTGSDTSLDPASVATCMTSTVTSYPQDETDETLAQTNTPHKQRCLSNEVINEESENSNSAENASLKINITPNNLKETKENERANSRKERTSRIGRCLRKGQKRDKNVNKTVMLQTDEHGITTTTHHETFKVSSYNIYRKDTRKSVKEKHRLANIKTAGILFTVTLVFILAFLPAWLMATKIIARPNMILFYMYFIYNVANPFIYAFFNQTFQQEMKTVLKCK